MDFVVEMIKGQPQKLIDVGCGWNEFCGLVRQSLPDVRCLGLDFACPGADLNACATHLPFADKSQGVLTAFDMLEHVLPEQVDDVLAEFARVSHTFVFSIAHQPSRVKWQGETLHPTVQPLEWWMQRIMRAGGCDLRFERGYVTGRWGNAVLNVPSSTRCVVVGNGPSLLEAERGHEIDGFDEIVRFNRYRLAGFELSTGKRTTLWSTFGHGYLPGDESERPQRMIFVHGERGEPAYNPTEIYRIPRWLYKHVNEQVQAKAGKKVGLSSGLLVATWLLQVVGLEKITLAGFDHFRKDRSSKHHYYNPRSYGRPPELDGDAEAELLASFVSSGRVSYL